MLVGQGAGASEKSRLEEYKTEYMLFKTKEMGG